MVQQFVFSCVGRTLLLSLIGEGRRPALDREQRLDGMHSSAAVDCCAASGGRSPPRDPVVCPCPHLLSSVTSSLILCRDGCCTSRRLSTPNWLTALDDV